jgi:hypothetical protein
MFDAVRLSIAMSAVIILIVINFYVVMLSVVILSVFMLSALMLRVIELSALTLSAYKLSYIMARLEFCNYGSEFKFESCRKAILQSISKFVTRTKPKSFICQSDVLFCWVFSLFWVPYRLSTLMLSAHKLSYTIARLEFCSYGSEFKFESFRKAILQSISKFVTRTKPKSFICQSDVLFCWVFCAL